MVGDGKTKLMAVFPYEITLVMARTRPRDVAFEPEGLVDGNGGEVEVSDVSAGATLLEDRTTKLGRNLVATVSVEIELTGELPKDIDELILLGEPVALLGTCSVDKDAKFVLVEEETFALGIRVANVAEELGMVALVEGVLRDLKVALKLTGDVRTGDMVTLKLRLAVGEDVDSSNVGMTDDVNEELAMLRFRLGRLKLVEKLPANDDSELGESVGRGRVAAKLGAIDVKAEGSTTNTDELLSKALDKLETSSEAIGTTWDVAEGNAGDEEMLNESGAGDERLKLTDTEGKTGVSRLLVDVSSKLDMGVSAETDTEVDKMRLSDGVRPGDSSVDMSETLRVLGSVEGLSNEIVNSSLRVGGFKETVVDSLNRYELQDSEGSIVGCPLTSGLVAVAGIVEIVDRAGLEVSSIVEDNESFTVIEVLVNAIVEPPGKVDVNVERMLEVCSTSVPVGSPTDKADDTVGSVSPTEAVDPPGGISVIVLGKYRDGSEPKVAAILDGTPEERLEIVGKKVTTELFRPLGSSGIMDPLIPALNRNEDGAVGGNNVDAGLEGSLLIVLVNRE